MDWITGESDEAREMTEALVGTDGRQRRFLSAVVTTVFPVVWVCFRRCLTKAVQQYCWQNTGWFLKHIVTAATQKDNATHRPRSPGENTRTSETQDNSNKNNQYGSWWLLRVVTHTSVFLHLLSLQRAKGETWRPQKSHLQSTSGKGPRLYLSGMLKIMCRLK